MIFCIAVIPCRTPTSTWWSAMHRTYVNGRGATDYPATQRIRVIGWSDDGPHFHNCLFVERTLCGWCCGAWSCSPPLWAFFKQVASKMYAGSTLLLRAMPSCMLLHFVHGAGLLCIEMIGSSSRTCCCHRRCPSAGVGPGCKTETASRR